MNKFILCSLTTLTIGLTGCMTMAPKYTRSDAPIPDKWPTGSAYESSVQSTENQPRMEPDWRMFYTDKKLQQVIKMALDNNRDLRLAALNVVNARALYNVQRNEIFPALYATSTGGETRTSTDLTEPGYARNSEYYDVNFGILSWEIDFFGRVRSLKDQALESFLATEEARRSSQILLVSNVANTYMGLTAEQEALALAKETYKTQKDYYDLVRRQHELGIATELDLRRAQTPVETARLNVAIFTQNMAKAQNALALLVGYNVPDDLLPDKLNDIDGLKNINPGLNSEILLNRPDILAAEHQLKAAHAFIGAARAAFFPSISLTTTLGTASNDLSGLFKGGNGTWAYAPQIMLPVFDARTWSAYRVSKAQREIAQTEYERTIQNAFREVADALAVQGTVDEQVDAQQALVEALAETYHLSKSRYENGIDSFLGVLDAQRSLFTAQQSLISLRLAQRVNHVNLYAALGGGTQPETDSIPMKR